MNLLRLATNDLILDQRLAFLTLFAIEASKIFNIYKINKIKDYRII